MRLYTYVHIILISLCGQLSAEPGPELAPPAVETVQQAVEKGLFFVERQSMNWWHENKCVSCHEGPLLMAAHHAAKQQGVPVDQQKLDFWGQRWVFKGALEKVRKDGKPDTAGKLALPWLFLYRDPDHESSAQRAAAFAAMFRVLRQEQQPDGQWKADPRLNYLPWILLSLAALEKSALPFDPEVRQEIAASRRLTETWLQTQARQPPEKSEELAGWAVYEFELGTAQRGQVMLDELIARQRVDGSWGMTRDEPAHNLVTAVALLALKRCGLANENASVIKAQRFLLAAQAEDGRWPTNGRYFHPERVDDPISAWASGLAVTALCATMPKLPAGTKPIVVRDPELVAKTNQLALVAADGYTDFIYAGDPTEPPPQ